MDSEQFRLFKQLNHTRYQGQSIGHYESFFQRANHPSRPLAFWIRYTIFSPKNAPELAIGELWAIWFDGEKNKQIATKLELPFSACKCSGSDFSVKIGDAVLGPEGLQGKIENAQASIGWDLQFSGREAPLWLLPTSLYEAKFPAAKSLVGLPLARYSGNVEVNGEKIAIEDWVGSQNHNWGSRHTDFYAWGQVAGFDTHPESFLEVATAQLKIGPFWTPRLTPLVLRHRKNEFKLNSIFRALLSDGKLKDRGQSFDWEFRAEDRKVKIEGKISAEKSSFVGLPYYNPPGGIKQCLNSKIGFCEISFEDRDSGVSEILFTKNRAAFEILTDAQGHQVKMADFGFPIRPSFLFF